VLGRLKAERVWQWGAYGKQPWARDYFKVGKVFPLLNGFADWIEKGYTSIAGRNTATARQHSWRFWTREARQDHIVCGVIRDSADALGRPYPFMVIGTGPLEGWEKNWELVPFACDNAWVQAEYLSTKAFSDPGTLGSEVSGIRSPVPSWSKFTEQRDGITKTEATAPVPPLASLAGTEVFLRIDEQSYDCFQTIVQCHSALKERSSGTPNAVFMGGTLNRTYFVQFSRPLNVSDFAHLWSIENEPCS
jgi:type VI secretion system protein VasJ